MATPPGYPPRPGQPPVDPPQPAAFEQPIEETADVAVPDATQDMPDVEDL